MQSKEEEITLDYIYPPQPTTSRGQSLSVQVNKDLSQIVYCTSSIVVIRNYQNLQQCDIYLQHKNETTCAKFSPNGCWICSADSRGNILIWDAIDKQHNIKATYDGIIAGPIKDISWTFDGQRIAAVGEGKQQFGKVFIWDTGSSVGEINGCSKTLLSVDFKPTRPFRLAVCGEEQTVTFFEGPPFKYVKSHKTHNNFVNCVRFSKNGDKFISVSQDKKIVLYEGKSGELIKEFQKEAHQSGISYCDWVDENYFITASLDKTIKLWDINQEAPIKTFIVNANPQIEDQQLTSIAVGNDIISFSLSGTLNQWKNFKNASDLPLPNQQIYGHQACITDIKMCNNNLMISGDANGRILIWQNRQSFLPKGVGHVKNIIKLSISINQKYIYSACRGDEIKQLDLNSQTFTSSLKLNVPVLDIKASQRNDNIVYVLSEKGFIIVLEDLKEKPPVKALEQFKFTPTFFDIDSQDKLFAVGDIKGGVYLIENNTFTIKQQLNCHITKISAILFTKNHLIIGDSSHIISVWDYQQCKLLTDQWIYHSAMITSLSADSTNKWILSTSIDNKAIIWSLNNLERVVEIKEANKKGVFAGCFDNSGSTIITGGGDNLIKEFKCKFNFN